MKSLGIIGGMSPESTVSYYQMINREVNRRLGGNSSADIWMRSVNFEAIAALRPAGDWQSAGKVLAESARQLAKAGAQTLVLTTNTMHKVAEAIKAQRLGTVGLLGTRFTMNDGFYTERMQRLGVATLVPSDAQQAEIHRVIFEELCCNRFTDEARQAYLEIMADLKAAGAQGVIFGCTEIGLLLKPEDCPLPVFDSTAIHAMAAVEFVLS